MWTTRLPYSHLIHCSASEESQVSQEGPFVRFSSGEDLLPQSSPSRRSSSSSLLAYPLSKPHMASGKSTRAPAIPRQEAEASPRKSPDALASTRNVGFFRPIATVLLQKGVKGDT